LTQGSLSHLILSSGRVNTSTRPKSSTYAKLLNYVEVFLSKKNKNYISRLNCNWP